MNTFRILVIANDAIDGSQLRELLWQHADGAERTEVLVVAPALSSRLRFWVSDVDPARRRAEARLLRSLPGLEGDGMQVHAAIGDADPLNAIADFLRLFPAHEIVLVTHPEEEQHWVEHDLVERARSQFEVPIVHLVAGPRRLASAA
jgi:GABA permease